MPSNQNRKLTNEVVATASDDEREERVTVAEKETIIKQMEKAEPIKFLPDWQLDPVLKDSPSDTLSIEESQFFEELIETYLKPYDVSKQQKVRFTLLIASKHSLTPFEKT